MTKFELGDFVMTTQVKRPPIAPRPTTPLETVEVIEVKPLQEEGAGVYEVTVRVDDRAPGSSVVRTLPRRFAYQQR